MALLPETTSTGKVKVRIAADYANPENVGKIRHVDPDDAKAMVAEGRAQYVRDRDAEAAEASTGDDAETVVTQAATDKSQPATGHSRRS